MSDTVKGFLIFSITILVLEFLLGYCYSLYIGTEYSIASHQVIIYLIMAIMYSFWRKKN